MWCSHSVPVQDGSVTIEEDGDVCIPAAELKRALGNLQPSHQVVIRYSPSDAKLDHSVRVQSSGDVTIGVVLKGKGKEKTVETIVAYPASEFEAGKPIAGQTILVAPREVVKQAYEMVVFATNPTDYNGIFDKVGIFDSGESVSFVGTDNHRCAVFNVKKSAFKQTADNMAVLCDVVLMSPTLGVFNDGEEISVTIGSDGSHIGVSTEGTKVNMQTVGAEGLAKYVNWRKVTEMKAGPSFVIDRNDFMFALRRVANANRERCFVSFPKGSDAVVLRSEGIALSKAVNAFADCETIQSSLSRSEACIYVSFTIECLSKLAGEKVEMSFSQGSEGKVRITSPDTPDFVHVMQRLTQNEKPGSKQPDKAA